MTPTRTILPQVRRELDIPARSWADFQGFAERAERACDLRLEQHDAGIKVAQYRKGDMLRIVGPDLLTGEIGERLARFKRINSAGLLEVDDGSQMMGKPITRQIEPGQVIGMAAE